MSDPLLFLLGVVTLLGAPGPTNTLLALSGAAAGVRRSLPLLAAELIGYLIAIGIIRLLLEPALVVQPILGSAVKVAAALYLGWLALRLWRPASPASPKSVVSAASVFVTTLLNPKALVVALAMLPAGPDVWLPLAAFSFVALGTGLGWIVIGSRIGAAAGARSAIVPRVAAVALAGFAGLLLTSAFS